MLFYVAAGSAAGGVARYLLAGWVQGGTSGDFPWGTLAVNVVGSLVLGAIMQYSLEVASISPQMRVALTIGFCGGFTTFSTYSYEGWMLVSGGDLMRGLWYLVASVVLSLAAVAAGMALTHAVLSRAV